MTIEDIRTPGQIDRLHSLLAQPDLAAGLRNVGVWRHRRKDGTELDAEVRLARASLRGARGPGSCCHWT